MPENGVPLRLVLTGRMANGSRKMAGLSDMGRVDKAIGASYDLLNLTHRNISENPIHVQPGEHYRVRLHQFFPQGHRPPPPFFYFNVVLAASLATTRISLSFKLFRD